MAYHMTAKKAFVGLGVLLFTVSGLAGAFDGATGLESLLPQLKDWSPSEDPQSYFPESLFEYINGAAEIYLSYEFKELIVAQYQKAGSPANLSVEIYDMAAGRNAFGIYSAERFPDNRFIEIGSQGYIEEGTLNFLVGRYYVKLLCFDCEEEATELRRFAGDIVRLAEQEPGFPVQFSAFPEAGRLPHTDKFILRNVLGYGFLHDGYLATYRIDDQEFDCFVLEGSDPEDAAAMLEKFLEAKGSSSKTAEGHLIKDRYYHHIYIARTGRYLCGVMKIRPGFEELGERFLRALVENAGRLKATGR